MTLTAANTQPVQTQQMAGAPQQMAPQRPSASILLRKGKKKPAQEQAPAAKGKPSAAILTRRPGK